MKLIANGINGEYLQNIILAAPIDLEWVKVAVAYSSGTPELIDFCFKNEIPLYFWGRIDETFPVSVNVLRKFLSMGPEYQCKLIHEYYHPKIMWFEGYGAYIGSANLTKRGWYDNVECGVWFSQAELEENGLISELENIFIEIDERSEPLTEELLNKLIALQDKYGNLNSELNLQKQKLAKDFESAVAGLFSKNYKGLTRVESKSTAGDKAKNRFKTEWTDTLTLLRAISEEVSQDGNRPDWVNRDVPKGVQVDQFLDAYYYGQVKTGNRSRHEEFHLRNNSKTALKEAMNWWKRSGPTDFEGINEFIYTKAPELQRALTKENIAQMDEELFVKTCKKVHAFLTAARQTTNEELGLPDKTYLKKYERAETVARWLWKQKSKKGASPKEVLEYVLYGDSKNANITDRIWDAIKSDDWHVRRFGLSCIGEIVGWAMPNQYPPRNGRTSKALYALGYSVKIYSE
jgi:hypothetical protein